MSEAEATPVPRINWRWLRRVTYGLIAADLVVALAIWAVPLNREFHRLRYSSGLSPGTVISTLSDYEIETSIYWIDSDLDDGGYYPISVSKLRDDLDRLKAERLSRRKKRLTYPNPQRRAP